MSKELTDEQIRAIWALPHVHDIVSFARAVIAAYREANGYDKQVSALQSRLAHNKQLFNQYASLTQELDVLLFGEKVEKGVVVGRLGEIVAELKSQKSAAPKEPT